MTPRSPSSIAVTFQSDSRVAGKSLGGHGVVSSTFK